MKQVDIAGLGSLIILSIQAGGCHNSAGLDLACTVVRSTECGIARPATPRYNPNDR